MLCDYAIMRCLKLLVFVLMGASLMGASLVLVGASLALVGASLVGASLMIGAGFFLASTMSIRSTRRY
jgi:hypothetical protein